MLQILSRIPHGDLYCNLALVHQTLCGKTAEEAEMGFLEEVTGVEEYGVLFHKVSRVSSHILFLRACSLLCDNMTTTL